MSNRAADRLSDRETILPACINIHASFASELFELITAKFEV